MCVCVWGGGGGGGGGGGEGGGGGGGGEGGGGGGGGGVEGGRSWKGRRSLASAFWVYYMIDMVECSLMPHPYFHAGIGSLS